MPGAVAVDGRGYISPRLTLFRLSASPPLRLSASAPSVQHMSRPDSVLPHGRFPAVVGDARTYPCSDLFSQGVYRHRISVVGPQGNALPLSFSSSPSSKKSKARGIDVAGSDAFSAPARLTESSFLTRSFLIRYVEEHVSLNDAAAFRVELDVPLEARSSSSSSAGGGATGAPVTLVLELMWCDLEEGPDGEPSGLKGDFAAVAKKEFRLNGIAKGIHAYSPLIYDDAHFCSTGLMVHSVLSDIRFRSTARGGAGNGTGTAGASASTGSGAGSAAGGGGGGGGGATGGGSGGGGGSGSSGSGGGGSTAPANVQPQGRVLNPTTFAEHIFPPPGRGAAALQRLRNSGYYERSDPSHRDRANRLHRLYLDMLADSYDSLLSCIRAIDENCMDSNQRCVSLFALFGGVHVPIPRSAASGVLR